MAELPYISTSANDNNDDKENDTCTDQDDDGTLANLPPPYCSHAEVHQQATSQYATPQGSTLDTGDVPGHPIWYTGRAGCLSYIIEESVNQQVGVALSPPEVEVRDVELLEKMGP